MLRNAVIAIIKAKRTWMVGSATDQLYPLYEKLGCEKTDLKYAYNELGGSIHHVILINCINVVSGAGVSPILWNMLGDDMAIYLEQNGLI